MRLRLGAAVLSCMAAGASSVAAQTFIPNVSGAAVRYLTAVLAHAPGQNDDAVDTLAAWTSREFDQAFADLRELVSTGDPDKPPAFLERFGEQPVSINMLLKRAAMLHSDIARIRRQRNGGYALPPEAGLQHHVAADGKVVDTVSGTFHWDAARRLMGIVRPAPGRDADVLLWYQATSALLQQWNDYYALQPHLTSARALFPKDPVLLMYDGAVHEDYADPRVHNAFTKDESTPQRTLPCRTTLGCAPPLSAQFALRPPAQEWHEAELALNFALEGDPNLAEARVRLGRVVGLQGRHGEAIEHLRKVLNQGASVPPVLRYFAWLLVGRELQTVGRGDEAAQAYRQADALYPGSQEARLGLSQTAQSRGDRESALNYLGGIRPYASSSGAGDPWWAYDRFHSPTAGEQ